MNPKSENFLWGAVTSAYQIEGALAEDGRGRCIWDDFAELPGKIADGSNGAEACDHYHRWREDVELLRWLGVDVYRFSTAWPRVFPEGRGRVNPAGLDFYDALVDALLAANIRPFITLYHWDLPTALQKEGGWANRDTATAFAEYAAAMGKRLGDRVTDWITHNEPWCASILGHEVGEHAPGHKNPGEALRAAHHILYSHGLAVEALRRTVPGAEVGIVLNLTPASPATGSEGDRDAARWFDGFFNRWFLDPVFRGRYPEDAIADRVRRGHLENAELPFVEPGDLEIISAPMDFLGINYYSRAVLRMDGDGEPEGVTVVPEDALTDMGWEVYPQGLHDLLVRVHREYAPGKIYITENGAAYRDAPDDAGRIRDPRRTEYLESHIAAVRRAAAAGVPAAGYFAWSLLDNFEWAHGFEKRFGLVWVDYATQKRIPKDSARWYRSLIADREMDEALTRT